MREFLAIVGDTWRQSRQQVVFIILCVIMALVSIVMIAYPKIHTDAETGEQQFGLQFIDEPVEWPAEMWEELATQSRMTRHDSRVNPMDMDPEAQKEVKRVEQEVRDEFREEAKSVPMMQRSVELWSWIAVQIIYTISMLLFIGACAAYYPDLLATGAVDVVLAKPLTRLQVFLGKYLGGLVLFAAAVTISYVVVTAGIGMRTGIWHWGILRVIPLHVFSAAVLYAIVGLFGVLWRSTSLAVIIGYIFYTVIDTAIGAGQQFQRMGMGEDIPLLNKVLAATPYMPSFGFMKEVAVNQCLYAQPFDSQPIVVGAVWLLITLALGFWKFRRTDF